VTERLILVSMHPRPAGVNMRAHNRPAPVGLPAVKEERDADAQAGGSLSRRARGRSASGRELPSETGIKRQIFTIRRAARQGPRPRPAVWACASGGADLYADLYNARTALVLVARRRSLTTNVIGARFMADDGLSH